MTEEEDLSIWISIRSYFREIISLLLNTDFLLLFDTYGLTVLKSIRTKIGYEPKQDDGKIIWEKVNPTYAKDTQKECRISDSEKMK